MSFYLSFVYFFLFLTTTGSISVCLGLLYKAFTGCRGSCATSDTLPHVMPLDSVLVAAEENQTNMGSWSLTVKVLVAQPSGSGYVTCC